MLRAVSTRTRRSPWGYEQLADDEASTEAEEKALVPKLSRAHTLPAKLLTYSRKLTDATVPATQNPNDQVKKASKIHPFFSLFDMSRKRRKKATAKPEVSRYLEYIREGGGGGLWNMKPDIPVVNYK